jgi:hypothetical protein
MRSERYSRQSFLGADAEERIARCVVGVVGLGGGGSYIVQQLAHIGFKRYVLFDGQSVEDSNLNRLVGASAVDVAAGTSKLHIAKMMILGIQPDAEIRGHAGRWQEKPELLRSCHIVFGCVDSYAERDELERCTRRYLMDYIDIGMDVRRGEDCLAVIGGQVILSTPGGPCMRCLGFLTDKKLSTEAAQYGNAGGRPQVVWSNGVLASTAVGIAVGLITDWARLAWEPVYLGYDGNRSILEPHRRLKGLGSGPCPHYSGDEVGEPVFMHL